MDVPISVAVVGVGNFGRFHAEMISQRPNAKLIAVADINTKRATEMGNLFSVDAVTDYRDLLGAYLQALLKSKLRRKITGTETCSSGRWTRFCVQWLLGRSPSSLVRKA